MGDVKNQMEGVTRTYTELDNKMADKGGVENLIGMNHKIRQALEIISIGEGTTHGNPHPCPLPQSGREPVLSLSKERFRLSPARIFPIPSVNTSPLLGSL